MPAFFQRLQFKFMLTFLFVAVIPGMLFSSAIYYVLSQKAIRESVSEAHLLLAQINKNLDTHLNEMQRVALIPNFDSNIQHSLRHPSLVITRKTKPDESLYSTMNVFTQFNFLPYTTGISIFHTDGTLLYSQYYSKINTPLKQRLNGALWFRQFSESNTANHFLTKRDQWPDLHINGTPENQYYKNWVFSYVQKLYSYPGRVYSGALVIDIDREMFRYIFDNANNKLRSQYVVFDPASNEVLYRNSDVYSTDRLLNLMQRAATSNENTSFEEANYVKMDGEQILVSQQVLKRSGWVIMSFIPKAEITKDSNVILQTIIIVLLVCTVLTVLLSISFAKRLTKPVLDLQASMEKVESGDLNIRYHVVRRDEIGLLGKSFNRMLDQLNRFITRYYTLEVLRSQINPHFLYNSLGTIASIAKVKRIPEIHLMASSLAKLFRYSINQGNRELVTFDEEINIMMSYIEAQKIRFGDQIQVTWDIQEEIYSHKTMKLVLQPLLENAFSHGIEPKGKGEIHISGGIYDNEIRIAIQDTGVGMSYEQLIRIRELLETPILLNEFKKVEKRGVGMINVNQRLRLSFGAGYGIQLDSTKDIGTKVTLFLPIIAE